ncbi:hypothetical protein HN51_028849 [Arachis hypogaea]|uniref:DOG1 domain-containing protein n=2 Tax=Arachis TaxID=3817 RepID=A0A445BGX9_ARAHY|nr:TGACG-sequence-specific DNA-binding protein TGA-1A [Arachis duranensis]XP_025619893.1 TGACG-sequence-specific DNA-binding protein TGA-1A [Arachis hypogaea]QHO35411.1 TGACG-sequence-specific DNA-binding protein TGA-1A [Arachis hypogaea]RYR37917.1 hypothetical protein Ahy_A09g042833 [Arachis hypogaea]
METSAPNVNVLNFSSSFCCGTDECDFRWIGGFRPSKILQVMLPQLEDSCNSQEQVCDIIKFGKSCEEAEYALSQGMEKLHQLHAKATAAGDKGSQLIFVSQMVSFLKQANYVRQEFLHQFSRFVTVSQQAQILLALGIKLSQDI